MTSQVALLNRITYYIVNRKGKQMRPMFVFLTSKMVQQERLMKELIVEPVL
jgi:octaprenyl-diphosphate synthase